MLRAACYLLAVAVAGGAAVLGLRRVRAAWHLAAAAGVLAVASVARAFMRGELGPPSGAWGSAPLAVDRGLFLAYPAALAGAALTLLRRREAWAWVCGAWFGAVTLTVATGYRGGSPEIALLMSGLEGFAAAVLGYAVLPTVGEWSSPSRPGVAVRLALQSLALGYVVGYAVGPISRTPEGWPSVQSVLAVSLTVALAFLVYPWIRRHRP